MAFGEETNRYVGLLNSLEKRDPNGPFLYTLSAELKVYMRMLSWHTGFNYEKRTFVYYPLRQLF